MTRVILLGIIATAMLVIAPFVGASNSLTLTSSRVGSDSLNSRKGIFDDIFGNNHDSNNDSNRREDWDEERDRHNDRYDENDHNDDNDEDHNSSDEFDFRQDHGNDRHHGQGDSYNPYGRGNPRGGGQYEWR